MLERFTMDGKTRMRNDGEVDAYATAMKSYLMNGCFDAGLRYKYPSITKVVINVPATIVFWSDGTKTVVKCAKNESFDAEKGVAMAIAKKFLPKQYKKKLKAMTDEALAKYEDTLHKDINKLEKILRNEAIEYLRRKHQNE